jgi:transcriptional regulator with XRE-family HTH domain
MEKTLQDTCRDAKLEQHITAQEIADQSGVPLSSVNNFFASTSKAPGVYAAGPICKVLGVSLDRYFGIVEVVLAQDQIKQLQQDHDEDVRLARIEGAYDELHKSAEEQKKKEKRQRTMLYITSLLSAILLGIVTWYMAFDYRMQNDGLIRSGTVGTIAWVIIALLAVGVGVITSVLLLTFAADKKSKQREETEDGQLH